MSECERSESTSNSFIGIVLVLLACCCYAFGNCLQRCSLLKQPNEKVFGVLNRNLGWLLGAIIYFSANGIYAIALSFAPVSVLAAVFSLTIVANALCAVLLLGDKIPSMAYPGYAFVLAGSVLFSVTIDAQVCHFGPDELRYVMTSAPALVFWATAGILLTCGAVFARWFEKVYPLEQSDGGQGGCSEEQSDVNYMNMGDGNDADPEVRPYMAGVELAPSNELSDKHPASNGDPHAQVDAGILLCARFIYPTSLGATEAVGSLLLKAVNSLLTTIVTAEEDDIVQHVHDDDADFGLWVALMGAGIFVFLGVVFWLRLVYSRFEITGAFPVEFGMLTFGSVVGGFAVFEDHKFVENTSEWGLVSSAGLLMLGGIAVVAYASWKAKVDEKES